MRTLRARTLRALAVAAGTLLITAAAHAGQPVVGSWWANVDAVDCTSGAVLQSFNALSVYHHGGTLNETNTGDPTLRGVGVGTWRRDRHGYIARWTFIRYDGGVFIGTQVITRRFELLHDGTLRGSSTFDVVLPNGQVVFTGCARDTAVPVARVP